MKHDSQLTPLIVRLESGTMTDAEMPELLERLEAIENDDTQPRGDQVAAILLRASIYATRPHVGR